MTEKEQNPFSKKIITLIDGRKLIYYNFTNPEPKPELLKPHSVSEKVSNSKES